MISGADIDIGLTARVQRSRESLEELQAAAETVKKLFGASQIRFALPKIVSDEFKSLGTDLWNWMTIPNLLRSPDQDRDGESRWRRRNLRHFGASRVGVPFDYHQRRFATFL